MEKPIRPSRTNCGYRMLMSIATELTSTLDYGQTLRNVARLSVPFLGDWCTVDLYDSATATLRRVAVHHRDPAKADAARQLTHRPPQDRADAPIGPMAVIRSRQPTRIKRVTQAELDAIGLDARQQELLREIGVGPALFVPLLLSNGDDRGQPIGALTFVRDAAEGAYTAAEERLATMLARCAAVHIENCRLYNEALRGVRMRDLLMSVISHDLRNPLSAISMGLQILRSAKGSGTFDDRQRRVLGHMERATGHLRDLISDLLALRRSETAGAGRLDLRSQPVQPVVERCLGTMRFLTEKCGVTLLNECREDLVWVFDEEKLQAAIALVLEFCIFQLRPGGEIRVCAEVKEDRLSIRVVLRGEATEILPTKPMLPAARAMLWAQDGCLTEYYEDELEGFVITLPRGEEARQPTERSAVA